MKQHFKIILIGLLILASSSNAQNNSTFTEKKVKAINAEISDSFFQGDISVLDKYLYEGTEIFIDLDPNPNSGVAKITLKMYRDMAKLTMDMADDLKVKEDVIEIKIDEKKNQAILKVNAHVLSDFMGVKTEEESITTTTYGVINGEIKILKMKNHIVSFKAE